MTEEASAQPTSPIDMTHRALLPVVRPYLRVNASLDALLPKPSIQNVNLEYSCNEQNVHLSRLEVSLESSKGPDDSLLSSRILPLSPMAAS